MSILIITTGGTFDKVYYDALSDYKIGEPMIAPLYEEANVTFDYEVQSLLKKDSLDMDEEDRAALREAVAAARQSQILVTHGTDTMVHSARELSDIGDKTVVLFGAMQPARMRYSDAMFNLGVASAAVQLLPAGIYIAMNGQVFDALKVTKNRAQGRFEPIEG